MKKNIYLFSAVFSIMLVFNAIAWSFSPIDVIIAKHNGDNSISKVYPVTVYQAWQIAIAVLQMQKANTIDAHYKEDYVLTSVGPEDCPCRTEVGVWVESENGNSAKVTIVTKGRVYKDDFTNLRTFPDTIGPDFQKKFEQGVRTVLSGGKLPVNFRKD